jgi:hypothetical protein
MKKNIDSLLEYIFGRYGAKISLVTGIILIVSGIVIFVTTMSKGKRIAAWVCIGIGGIGVLSGIIQMIFK